LCREEALDITKRFESVVAKEPKLSKVPLFAVIKEVAPTKDAEDDEKLGVAAFANNFFAGRPVFVDEGQKFYEYLGNRGITEAGLFTVGNFLRPWKLYGAMKEVGKRQKSKGGIEGNYKGDSKKLGGILVISPGSDDADSELLYHYQEIVGAEVPVDEFEAGLLKLAAGTAVCSK
jgi:hypothetical protein